WPYFGVFGGQLAYARLENFIGAASQPECTQLVQLPRRQAYMNLPKWVREGLAVYGGASHRTRPKHRRQVRRRKLGRKAWAGWGVVDGFRSSRRENRISLGFLLTAAMRLISVSSHP